MNKESLKQTIGSVPSIKLSLTLYVLTVILISIAGVVVFVVYGVEFQHFVIVEFLVQWGFICLPVVLVIWLWRFDYRETLNLNIPSRHTLIGTLLLAPSVCVILHQFLAWQMRIFPMPEELNKLVDVVRNHGQTKMGLVILFAWAAFSAPVCEELLYRGIMFSSLLRPGLFNPAFLRRALDYVTPLT